VYIYKGGTKGLQRTPAQTIQASEIDSSLRGFGYSISPAEDVDNNGYNGMWIYSVRHHKPYITTCLDLLLR